MGVDPVAPQQAVAEVRSAVRCEECHEPYVRGWEASAHAQAAASPYYRALGGGWETATPPEYVPYAP